VRASLRTVAVIVVAVAGLTLPGCTTDPQPERPEDEVSLNGAQLTARTPTETAILEARAAQARRESQEPRASKRKHERPLRHVTIALDPGHQLGNHHYPRQINAPVPAGGFTKPCNTTGTATDRGVAEATVNLQLARAVTRRLRALGARVRLTRTTNSQQRWGPCVDERGRFGKRVGARLMVSLHADGAAASAHGFHVIVPQSRSPWTSDIAAASLRLGKRLRAGLTHGGVPRSTYVGGGTALDVRGDLGTLNNADVPVAMVEIGNMRNEADARRMTSRSGRARYADALVAGIRSYLHR
jgi:N-acetylmuramoyl-L-alanine amidase